MKLKFKDSKRVHDLDVQKNGGKLTVKISGHDVEFGVSELPNNGYLLSNEEHAIRGYAVRRKDDIFLHINGTSCHFKDVTADQTTGSGVSGISEQEITAPMPGSVIKVLVNEGDVVKPGQALVIVEAMKMENEVRATADGRVEKVLVQAGQQVGFGEKLLEIAPADDEAKNTSSDKAPR